MEIIISKNKKIVTDKDNWIYSEGTIAKEGKNAGKRVWQAKWFYPNMEDCYFDLLDYFTRESDRKTLKEAFTESIEKLQGLKKNSKRVLSS